MKRLLASLQASWILAVTAVLAMPGMLPGQQSSAEPSGKKLIEYGWDVPYPDQVRRSIRDMEKTPFDGVIFRLREWNHAFDPRPWTEADLKPQLADLAAIEWNTFTDNFLCLYAANNWKMDWYDDGQWKNIAANLRLTAKAARIGRCVGIVFDPEPYGDNPWAYAGALKQRAFAEVEAQVRKRGGQFMTAIQEELPNVRLLTFFHQSLFSDVLAIADAQQRQQKLSEQHWALLSAFWNGALEAAAPGVRIVDGYELAYYFTRREQFTRAHDLIRRQSLSLVPPELHAKHAATVQAGMALYMDQVFALREPQEKYLAYHLGPAERALWFEHNVYFALESSDQYVWCYSERVNWWEDKTPEGADAAIRSARAKLAKGTLEDAHKLSSELANGLAAAEEKASKKK